MQYETLHLSIVSDQTISPTTLDNNHSHTTETPPLDAFEYFVTLSSKTDPDADTDTDDERLLGFSISPANEQGDHWLLNQ